MDFLSRKLHEKAGRHGPVMLMYHAVLPGNTTPAWPWAVSMRQFRAQLDFLVAEGYATPTMAQLVATPDTWTGRTVVITFDDGYVDNLAACDELEKRGLSASWFIVAGAIGHEPHWPADGRPAGRLLDAAELRAMHGRGFDIGSHTLNHVRLPALDNAALQHELIESRHRLEDSLSAPVGSFAYPYGAWDERCVKAVSAAGYTAACTTRTGWALRDKDPYRLRRLSVFNRDTVSSLARKLYLGDNAVGWSDLARYALRRVTG